MATYDSVASGLGQELQRLEAQVQKGEPFLPESLALWKALDSMKPRFITSAYLAWAYLSDVFKRRGYDLYVPRKDTDTTFWTVVYPVNYIGEILPEDGKPDRDVVLGSRRYVVPLFPYPAIWAATNQSSDEFIIKVVSDGQDLKGLTELRILEHLDQPDLRAHPRNRTVPVVEFVRYEQYTFAIFPRWTDFPEKEIRTPRTAVECCVQVTEALAFLHEQCIAHFDISMENIMINFFGYVDRSLSPVVEYFPISYGLIDFGESVFLDAYSSLAPPRDYAPRPNSAPEVSSGQPFDPFAADVYQTARFLLEQFYDLTGLDPEFLAILQAMTSNRPSTRISMAQAHRRFAALQTSWLRDPDADVIDIYGRRKNKALRERMRQDRKEEYGRVLSFHGSGMLWVDHVPGTIGCVDGNNPRKPGF
ncbi:hypothetical protein K523DRAFT_388322 [Schizophyllum commune Tattone D]|nr:hypothetical protein K523DRAFT_388322 [Schizophyllum commune Tattone D]